jgi:hypothetical protein
LTPATVDVSNAQASTPAPRSSVSREDGGAPLGSTSSVTEEAGAWKAFRDDNGSSKSRARHA